MIQFANVARSVTMSNRNFTQSKLTENRTLEFSQTNKDKLAGKSFFFMKGSSHCIELVLGCHSRFVTRVRNLSPTAESVTQVKIRPRKNSKGKKVRAEPVTTLTTSPSNINPAFGLNFLNPAIRAPPCPRIKCAHDTIFSRLALIFLFDLLVE